MKKTFLYLLSIFVLTFTSCEQYYNPGLNVNTVQEDTTKSFTEFEILMRFIPNSGDYINSAKVPSMVSAEDINDNLSKYFIIDLRAKEDYVKGHIAGAVNVQVDNILDYLDEFVSPSTFDKLVLTCYTGQKSSYVTSVLRLIGYDNVYAMKYGMSAWNRSLDRWTPKLSSKYVNALETEPHYKGKSNPYPVINTGAACGAEILEARAKTLLNTPFEKLMIDADRAFSDTSFYIVNYWPKANYDKGHIPGAIQYTPKKDFSAETYLKTLPTSKKILVYCFTGQHAAFAIAYLRMLGYNAFTIAYGANSFMHSALISREGWHGFKSEEKLNDFSLIEGEHPTDKAFEKQLNIANKSNESAPKKKVVKRKKKEVEGGCG
jgi:rhodanese-related sulfurtransferase